jgi:hypothetical protein
VSTGPEGDGERGDFSGFSSRPTKRQSSFFTPSALHPQIFSIQNAPEHQFRGIFVCRVATSKKERIQPDALPLMGG